MNEAIKIAAAAFFKTLNDELRNDEYIGADVVGVREAVFIHESDMLSLHCDVVIQTPGGELKTVTRRLRID